MVVRGGGWGGRMGKGSGERAKGNLEWANREQKVWGNGKGKGRGVALVEREGRSRGKCIGASV